MDSRPSATRTRSCSHLLLIPDLVAKPDALYPHRGSVSYLSCLDLDDLFDAGQSFFQRSFHAHFERHR